MYIAASNISQGLVMCIRNRRHTILCLSAMCIAGFVYSWQVKYHSVSLYSVQCILLPPIWSRCRTGYVFSGQAQYHYVSKYSVYCWFCVFGTDTIPFCVLVQCVLLVLCIRDKCNTILCCCSAYIAASNISRCRTGYVIIIITLFQEDNIFGTNASLTYGLQLQSYTCIW